MNDIIRLSEKFFSIQGEAERTGMLSLWIRFFGCNLKCDGFGQPDPTNPNTWELPREKVDVKSFASNKQLPVFAKGCDSGYSWDKNFKPLIETYTLEELQNELLEMMSARGFKRSFVHENTRMPLQLCFTGGEPLLFQSKILGILRNFLSMFQEDDNNKLKYITIETNGTRTLNDYFLRDLLLSDFETHISISPKLFHVSGEKYGIDLPSIKSLVDIAKTVSFKFVMNNNPSSWFELENARTDIQNYLSKFKYDHSKYKFWVMPVGARKEDQETSEIEQIAERAMNSGYQIAARAHIQLFGNKIGT